jgi:hypothetical protein
MAQLQLKQLRPGGGSGWRRRSINDSQRAIIAARMANRPGLRLKITFEMLQLKPVCRFRYRRPYSHQAGGPLTVARRWRVSTTMPSAEQ